MVEEEGELQVRQAEAEDPWQQPHLPQEAPRSSELASEPSMTICKYGKLKNPIGRRICKKKPKKKKSKTWSSDNTSSMYSGYSRRSRSRRSRR